MSFEERIGDAIARANRRRRDPAVAATEVYLDELLRQLQERLGPALVWKGGTVLRLLGNPRYSRDLDATLDKKSYPGDLHALRAAIEKATSTTPFLARSRIAVDRKGAGVGGELTFRVSGLKLPLKLGVEVSAREPILREAEPISTARISHALGTKPAVILKLADSELLAEKLRALLVRQAPRDFVDLHFCFRKGMKFEPEILREKMRLYQASATPIDTRRRMEETLGFLQKQRPEKLRRQIANLLPEEAEKLDFAVILADLRDWLVEALQWIEV